MKSSILTLLALIVITALHAQTIEEELNELGVFKEKLVFQWLNQDELSDTAPYVVIDRQIKSNLKKNIDPKKVKRIEKINDKLATHLFGSRAQNSVYRIVINENVNKDSYFKIITNPSYHSSCKTIEDKKGKQKCTEEYLKNQLADKIGNQENFVLEISVDFKGNIANLVIREGDSNKSLEKLFKKWKQKKYDWYPGIQSGSFVNQYIYYRNSKSNY